MRFKKKRRKTSGDVVAHFQKRCLERIGIILSQRVLKSLMAERKLVMVARQSREKTHWRLRKEAYCGKEMLQFDVLLVYDKRHSSFVTVWKYGAAKEIRREKLPPCEFGEMPSLQERDASSCIRARVSAETVRSK